MYSAQSGLAPLTRSQPTQKDPSFPQCWKRLKVTDLVYTIHKCIQDKGTLACYDYYDYYIMVVMGTLMAGHGWQLAGHPESDINSLMFIL